MQQTSERIHATAAQYGIWIAQQVDPEGANYLTAEVIELNGALDVGALQASVTDVLDHADTLHMRFEWDDGAPGTQRTLWQRRVAADASLPTVDFSKHDNPEQAAHAWMHASLSARCDVTSDALYRTALLRLSPLRHWWYLQVHHIALDGFGYGLLQQAVAARYNARVGGAPLPALPTWRIEPAVDADATYRETGGFERDRAFWREHLRGLPAPAQIAPKQRSGDMPRRRTLTFEPARADALTVAAARAGSDWSAWMLTAIGLWLAKQAGRRDLTFGMPVMNRLGTPVLDVPCMAMNLVPFAVHVRADASPHTLVAETAGQLCAIRPHLHYRYSWICGDLGLLEHDKPVFNQVVNLMPFDRRITFTGLTSDVHPVSAGPVKDLNVTLVVRDRAWRVTLEANPNAYDDARLSALSRSLSGWLAAFAAHEPDRPLEPLLDDLPPLSVCRGEPLREPVIDVLALVRQAAARVPDSIAIEAGDVRLDYRALIARVDALAQTLTQRGAAAHSRIAIMAGRSADAIVSMLAALQVGAAFVPLDPDGPVQRTADVLADAAPDLVLTRTQWRGAAGALPVVDLDAIDLAGAALGTVADKVPSRVDSMAAPCAGSSAAPRVGATPSMAANAATGVASFSEADAEPDAASRIVTDSETNAEPCARQPAYLLYTSGSTGKPNGVLVGRRALAQFVASTRALYGIGPSDRVLQFAPLHFDASIEEIFSALCNGATLVLRNDAMLDSVATFATAIERLRITVLDLPTAYWHVLAHALDADAARRLSGVRLVIIGGEAALPERIARWRALLPQQVLLNTYGPTEATIVATTARVGGPHAVWRDGDAVPIGLPRPGVNARLVDERLYPVAVGQTGELVLVGDALALEYLHDPELSAARFVMLPDTGERAYRTGDLAQLHDGQLRFLGRIDHQVKISGLRIEPPEIENLLLRMPNVREAAIVPVSRGGGICTLSAFVAGEPDVAALRAFLARSLPEPAIPDAWHVLDALPRNPNGKTDRKALLAHATAQRTDSADADADASGLERQVKRAFLHVLGDVPLTGASNFFDLGGKSLQAIQAAAHLAAELRRDVPVSMLFRHASVRALAQALSVPLAYHRPHTTPDAFAPTLTIQTGDAGRPALICFHPADGIAWGYLRIARHVPQTTVYGLQMSADETRQASDFDALAECYAARVRALQPHGPYYLLGWSLGGALAHGVAAKLARDGHPIGLLALMDSYPASAWRAHPMPALRDVLQILLSADGDFDTGGVAADALRERLLRANGAFASLGPAGLDAFAAQALRQMQMFRSSDTPRYDGDVLLFRAARHPAHAPRADAWSAHLRPGALQCRVLACSHEGMSDPAPMAEIGAVLAERLG
ncbi:non-ribosomal peptide synthetase [Burkholderia singularis]|uniref:Non-ribosomal peptide synthetase n=1 Tax=Burkholderia singularis TaxID=1503053 RepID=A0A118DP89_9BURK|nr:non-ribosomal peptide synthetase [Burkholderia singularis]KVE27649.1 non-ribosomal peptide synthetase [Burkholderia singularis]